LRAEVEEKIGPIVKIQFFGSNPLGICKLKFVSAIHAEECIKLLDGRFFDQRALKSFFWDGKTDYSKVRESDETLQSRVEDFGKWLEQD
jgi:HIV Tat-specific factor 1